MSMYFLDETDDWLEYQTIREETKRLDREYLEIGKELQSVEEAFKHDPQNINLEARMAELKKKRKAIEKKLDESLSMYR
ncbi:hypothetical protein [Desulfoferrobacter suflitae]|uniref:hypothetical protein n=1 Tax=Desulfoferrobacter suflitae TaxID=2865782 RepID=UPI00216480D5|nr:hypothetical protein [Desulfoferrobacter suflitae]MCK8602926.1 hypothetical protein [Desulfoferrobacter suflitae]